MVNWNDTLPYMTPKFVKIRDWRLGVAHKILMLLIFVKIIIMGIIVNCTHLKPTPVFGVSRITISQPTVGGCNPLQTGCWADYIPMTELPYCLQYTEKDVAWPAPPKDEKKPKEPKEDKKDEKKDEKKKDEDEKEETKDDKDIKKASEKKSRLLAGNSTGEEEDNGTKKKSNGTKKDSKWEPFEEVKELSPVKTNVSIAVRQEKCMYWDGIEMARGRSPVPGTIFVPTRLSELKQQKGCKPSKANKFACKTRIFTNVAGAKRKSFYVADAEDFRLLISQAYMVQTDHGVQTGNAGECDTYMEALKKENEATDLKKSKIQGHIKYKGAEGAPIPIPRGKDVWKYEDSAASTEEGDIISVGGLIKLADPRGRYLLDAPREDGRSLRWAGGVISVSIEYTNKAKLDPLGQTGPHYVISANYLPMDDYKIMYSEPTAAGRTVHDVHGILFLFTVVGKIHVFSVSYLLKILTTAMVSLAMAATLTDAIMMYVMEFSPNYTILKYQPTMDFSVFRERIGMLQKKPGYNPLDNKPMAAGDILNNASESGRLPGDKELLFLLLKFEQRMNRLDGTDAHNVFAPGADMDEKDCDPSARKIATFEEEYMKNYVMD
eukprot:gnl/TRDRNA2_/TRDRNA2_130541_c1_seq1.p1 gnl/TRDRNA2_/TRDRNA2_130541_c1~~gnl/TRDRNA2_/TRDRNA2_130541_c1_seq1.p1  ORF type:complete len:605 (-),score=151.31 gnl/TRDRNA2_/TRDRNA2_130541_c1_seq1:78-1892(-)